MWMSHVAHMHESCHTYEGGISLCLPVYYHIQLWWVMIQINESCPTCERVTTHMWMSHVAHMHESCHTYEGGISLCLPVCYHIQLWWVMIQINESCPTCERVTTHIWMSHVTHEWVMSHLWMNHFSASPSLLPHTSSMGHETLNRVMSHMWTRHGHDTHMNESCHTCEQAMAMTHIWMSHVTHVNNPWPWHTYEWDMSHMNETCHTHGRVISPSLPPRMSVMCRVTYELVTSHIWMSHGHDIHMNESCHTCASHFTASASLLWGGFD